MTTTCDHVPRLSAAEAAHWRDHGWVTIPQFFTPVEVRALQKAVTDLQAQGRLRNVATTGDGATPDQGRQNLQLCPCGPHHRLLRALPWHPPVVAAVQSLLGPDAAQELDQIFLKPAGSGTGTGWHTDNAYFRCTDIASGTGMWIAIHDAHRENGCMRILDRSHLHTWQHRRDGDSDHHITCADAVDEGNAIPIELRAGGVLFFNYGIAHATGPNRTDRDRAGLAYHFRRLDALPADRSRVGHYFHQGARLRIDGPECDGGQAWHGEDLRGVFADESQPR